jgi:hypothetical protein
VEKVVFRETSSKQGVIVIVITIAVPVLLALALTFEWSLVVPSC